jgi:cytochrome c553
MDVLAILLPFVLLGIAVLFIAFSGGPGRAREVYLTRGGRGLRLAVPLLYLVLGVGVPAIVIANRGQAEGGTGRLEEKRLSGRLEDGKQLFKETCSSCHSLAAVNARGITGPNLDDIGKVTRQRVLSAIRIGGTGQGRMPSGLLTGSDAQAVADYVSKVAGK